MDNRGKIGRAISKARSKLGLSRRGFAKHIGVSAPMIAVLEDSNSPITVNMAKRLEPILRRKWYRLVTTNN